MNNAYKVLNSEILYKGKICDVKVDEITLPDGRSAKREVVLHGNAAAVVAVDNEGKLILIRQYRHPAEKEVLEIPAGMLEDGEDPKICAIRELEEETSYRPKNMKHITSMYSAIGFCNEILHIFLADDLEQGEFNFDEDEFISVEKYSLQEALEMIFKGEIIDSKTIVGILAYNAMKSKF